MPGKECRNIVLATLILLAVVQPGAIIAATTDAPYNLARSLSIWGEAFLGGSPLLLAYALVRHFRTKERKVLICAGGVLVFVVVVAVLSLHFDRVGMEPYFRESGEALPDRNLIWLLVVSGLTFLLSVMSLAWIWELPQVYSDPFDVPLGIIEILLIVSIVLLAVKGRKRRRPLPDGEDSGWHGPTETG